MQSQISKGNKTTKELEIMISSNKCQMIYICDLDLTVKIRVHHQIRQNRTYF